MDGTQQQHTSRTLLLDPALHMPYAKPTIILTPAESQYTYLNLTLRDYLLRTPQIHNNTVSWPWKQPLLPRTICNIPKRHATLTVSTQGGKHPTPSHKSGKDINQQVTPLSWITSPTAISGAKPTAPCPSPHSIQQSLPSNKKRKPD